MPACTESERKASWRRAYIARRLARATVVRSSGRTVIPVSPVEGEEVESVCSTLLTHLASSSSWRASRIASGNATLAGYIPTPSELDVTELMRQWSLVAGPTVVPVPSAFTQRGQGPVGWVRWPSKNPPNHVVGLENVVAVLVPGLAFGIDGRRLGRGAGWYDRALGELPSSALIIGTTHTQDILDRDLIPWEPHDQAVDAMLTRQGLTVL